MEVEEPNEKKPEWRISPLWIGFSLSGVWILIFLSYGYRNAGEISSLASNNLGDFLAGVFAPLAFLWLFVATLLQKEELGAQREELALTRKVLKLQADELSNSVAQLKEQAQILEKQFRAQSKQKALEDIWEGVSTICSMVIAKFGGAGTHSTTGNMYKMSSFLPEQDLRDVLSKEDYIFLIDEINRRLETQISNLRQYVHTGHKIEIRKRPLPQDAEIILHHIDRTLQIPTTSGVPELSDKFSEYPLSTLREHVVVIRDFLSLP